MKSNKTIIPFWIIDKYPWEWESHLKRISDFILERGWWNECDAGICFNDSERRSDTSLRVHHFRTSNIKKELSQLDLFWKRCLENTDLIPAQKVKYPEGQSYRVLHLNNIKTLNIEIMQEGENLNNPNYLSNYFGGEKNVIPQLKKQCEPICQFDDLEDNGASNDNNDDDIIIYEEDEDSSVGYCCIIWIS